MWEYAIKKLRSHPKLFESINVFTENSNFFIKTTPKFKNRAIFLFSKEDQFRPEIISYHNIIRKFKTKKKLLVITKDSIQKPAYLSKEYVMLKKNLKNSDSFHS